MILTLKRLPLIFISGLALITAASIAIVTSSKFSKNPDILSLGLTVDISIIIPVLFYFFVTRKYKLSIASVIPAFAGSIVLATYIIPATNHSYLDIVKQGAVLAEIASIAYLVINILIIRKEFISINLPIVDFVESLNQSISKVYGMKFGGIFASEISIFYYLFFYGKKKRALTRKGLEFTYHKKSGYIEFTIAIIIASGIETFLIHYFLSSWSYSAALIFTTISVYSIFFLIADASASVKRPLIIYGNVLYLRTGLRWRTIVPLNLITDVRQINGNYVRSKETLRASLLKQVNMEMTLNNYVDVKGMYGLSKRVNKIYLYLDKPTDFISSLTSHQDNTSSSFQEISQ